MKVVAGEDCLITDFSSCSHYVNEVVGPCRSQSSRVCVCCGKVQVSETEESEVWYRKLFHKGSFQLYS